LEKKLKCVYKSANNPKDIQILKLYEDFSYEFLNFKFIKKKKNAYREIGKFLVVNELLKLNPRNKNKYFEHSLCFEIISNAGLKSVNKNIFKKFPNLFYELDSNLIYHSHSYNDSVFGRIYNDFNLVNKFSEDNIQKNLNQNSPIVTDKTTNLIYAKKINTELKCRNNTVLKQINTEYLKKLKVVIVVGHAEASTIENINEQKILATHLRSKGIQVIEIYPPNNWKMLIKETKGAHILIYSGHGSTAGDNNTGGICLDDNISSANDIRRDLKLHKNALVLFNHVCRGAGSSALDIGDIGVSEAAQRVINYSRPFFDIGAGVYYANNLCDSGLKFFNELLSGKSIEQIYINETNYYGFNIDLRIPSTNNMNNEIAISSAMYGNLKNYSIAFAGNPCFTIWDLFSN
jgi:hypothetical protein